MIAPGMPDHLGRHRVPGGEAGGLRLAPHQRREIGAVEAVSRRGGVHHPLRRGKRRQRRAGPERQRAFRAALQRAARHPGRCEPGQHRRRAVLAEQRHLVVERGQGDIGRAHIAPISRRAVARSGQSRGR